MRKILLISHFELAKGAYDTLSYFVGENALIENNVTQISAYTKGHENVDEELNEFWKLVSKDDQVIICTDILGGSVNQLVMRYLQRENTFIFTGFNLPLLIQLLVLPINATYEEIISLEVTGKEGVVCMNTFQLPVLMEDDE